MPLPWSTKLHCCCDAVWLQLRLSCTLPPSLPSLATTCGLIPHSAASSGRCRTATSCNHVLMGAIALVEVFMSLTRLHYAPPSVAHLIQPAVALLVDAAMCMCAAAPPAWLPLFWPPPEWLSLRLSLSPTSCHLALCHLHCLHVRLWLYFAARSTPAANPFLMAVHVGVFITPLHLINICITFCVPFPSVTSHSHSLLFPFIPSQYRPFPSVPFHFALSFPTLLLVFFFAIRPENGHRFWL